MIFLPVLILCFPFSANGIVFRVKSTNNTATLQRIFIDHPQNVQVPPTTTLSPPTPTTKHSRTQVITKRKYLSDYFSSTDDSFVDPWQSLYPVAQAPIAINGISQQNYLLKHLQAQNLQGSYNYLYPFAGPKVFTPLYWGLSGYGLYSYSAGNDLHNNQPMGSYKFVRDN